MPEFLGSVDYVEERDAKVSVDLVKGYGTDFLIEKYVWTTPLQRRLAESLRVYPLAMRQRYNVAFAAGFIAWIWKSMLMAKSAVRFA